MALSETELLLVLDAVRAARTTVPLHQHHNPLVAAIIRARVPPPNAGTQRRMRSRGWLASEIRAESSHVQRLHDVLREMQRPRVESFQEITARLLLTYRRGLARIAYYEIVEGERSVGDAWSRHVRANINPRWLVQLDQYRAARDALGDAARGFVDAHRDAINADITLIYAATMDARLRWARAMTDGMPSVEQLLDYTRWSVENLIYTTLRDVVRGAQQQQRSLERDISAAERVRPRDRAAIERLRQEHQEHRDLERSVCGRRRGVRGCPNLDRARTRLRRAERAIDAAERAMVERHLARLATPAGRADIAAGIDEARVFLRHLLTPAQHTAVGDDPFRLVQIYTRTLQLIQSGAENLRYQYITEISTSLYSAANPRLDLGIRVERDGRRQRQQAPGLGTYGLHPRWSIDVSVASGLQTFNVVPSTAVLPDRFGNHAGEYRYVRTRAIGDRTRGTTPIEDVFDKLAEAVGYGGGDRDILTAFPDERVHLLVHAGERSYADLVRIGRARTPPTIGDRRRLRGDRIIAALTYERVYGDEQVPQDIQVARTALLERLAGLLGVTIDEPRVRADVGHPSPGRVLAREDGQRRRSRRPEINRLLLDNTDGFLDAVWGLMWLARDRGADPMHRGAIVTLDHAYQSDGREIHIHVLYAHISGLASGLAAGTDLQVARDAFFCLTGSTGGAVGPHHHIEISVYGSDQQRGRELGYLLPHEFYPDEGGTRPGGTPPAP